MMWSKDLALGIVLLCCIVIAALSLTFLFWVFWGWVMLL